MEMVVDVSQTYLHRDGVDFHKSISGLVSIVEQEMKLSSFVDPLIVFCNEGWDRIKVIYWDKSGF